MEKSVIIVGSGIAGLSAGYYARINGFRTKVFESHSIPGGLTNDNLRYMDPLHQIPGLENLYTAGQWTAPYTGTVIAALSGRQAIELICHKNKEEFKTS